MIRVLVDADLILEVLLNRSGFVADAEEAFEMLQSQRIQGYVSELGLKKINLVLSQLEGSEVAEEIVAAIEDVVKACPVDFTLAQQARSLNIRDFESAVEVVCATAMSIGAIVTSDPQDFAGADLPVLQVGDLWQRQNLEAMLRTWQELCSISLVIPQYTHQSNLGANTMSAGLECPSCGKHSLVQKSDNVYVCLGCGFKKDFNPPPPKKTAPIFGAILMIINSLLGENKIAKT
jgi:predicted RNA-binding Zn-ribbon protein involved in translation (DUF1610 family)/predicted nucleic acid-binding protein